MPTTVQLTIAPSGKYKGVVGLYDPDTDAESDDTSSEERPDEQKQADDQTDACSELLRETNPCFGGTSDPFDELTDLVDQERDENSPEFGGMEWRFTGTSTVRPSSTSSKRPINANPGQF